MEPEMGQERRWIEHLSAEDVSFLKRFLLSSGTLKELARQYGVSYPTVRLRLDRLIEKVRLIDEQETAGPFELRLRTMYAEGKVDDEAFRVLLGAYRKEKEDDRERQDA